MLSCTPINAGATVFVANNVNWRPSCWYPAGTWEIGEKKIWLVATRFPNHLASAWAERGRVEFVSLHYIFIILLRPSATCCIFLHLRYILQKLGAWRSRSHHSRNFLPIFFLVICLACDKEGARFPPSSPLAFYIVFLPQRTAHTLIYFVASRTPITTIVCTSFLFVHQSSSVMLFVAAV